MLIYMLVILAGAMLAIPVLLLMIMGGGMWKSFGGEEKLSPFECGFIPQAKARLPFSTHFFLLSIVFLIFDVELILLFPVLCLSDLSVFNLLALFMALCILTAGTLLEWGESMLEWHS